MRFRVRRLLGVSAFYLLFGLHLPGCSSQQQDEEGLEVSEQGNEDDEGYEDEQYNNQGNEYENNEYENDEGNEYEMDNSAGMNATENDLQEIIQEMNGQQMADDSGDGYMEPLQQNPSVGMTPASVGSNQSTANSVSSSPMPFQPGGSPAAPGLPEIGSKMAYIVEAGDTLGKISRKIYGTPGRWNELATLSGMANPSRIYPGDLVYYTLDEKAVSFATAYESIQRGTESVQPGDTLATIAQRIYGSSKAWRSLWRHNDNIDNPDILTAGNPIYYVPSGAATAAINTIKSNIAKSSKSTFDSRNKVPNTLVNKEKLKNISEVTSKLNTNSLVSISNVFSSGLVAAI